MMEFLIVIMKVNIDHSKCDCVAVCLPIFFDQTTSEWTIEWPIRVRGLDLIGMIILMSGNQFDALLICLFCD